MKQTYDKNFRQEAVRLALSSEKSIAETAKNLGIKENTLYNWVSKAKNSKEKITCDETINNSADLINELNRLRKENARLKEEREILKKAAAFFAKKEQKR